MKFASPKNLWHDIAISHDIYFCPCNAGRLVPLEHLITHNSWWLVLCRKSFTVNDIAGGVVNSFGMSFTLAIWAAHAAKGNELGSGRIQGH